VDQSLFLPATPVSNTTAWTVLLFWASQLLAYQRFIRNKIVNYYLIKTTKIRSRVEFTSLSLVATQ
jgi:hypothetical protein